MQHLAPLLLSLFKPTPKAFKPRAEAPRSPGSLGSPRHHSRRAAGFTLMEVLVSIGILTLGLVGVAAVFPSAIFLQKQAVNEAFRHQHTRSADSMLQGKGLSNLMLIEATNTDNATGYFTPDSADASYEVYSLADITPGTTITPAAADPKTVTYAASLLNRWPVADRSFPSTTPDPANRDFYWVPMIQRGPEANDYIADWNIFVFMLMPRQQDHTFDETAVTPATLECANDTGNIYEPKVYRMPITNITDNVIDLPNTFDATVTIENPLVAAQLMRIGDKVLGDNGEIYRVTFANGGQITVTPNPSVGSAREPQSIWFAAPADFESDGESDNSVVLDIRLLSNNVVRLPPLN